MVSLFILQANDSSNIHIIHAALSAPYKCVLTRSAGSGVISTFQPLDIFPVSTNRLNWIWAIHHQYTRLRPISRGAEVNVSWASGRSTAQAATRQLSTATDRVRSQVRSYGISDGLSGNVAGFLRLLSFPCHFSFHWMLRTHLPSGAGKIGSLLTGVPSGLGVTSPHELKKKIHFKGFYRCTWSGNKVPGIVLHYSR
jgi:hypothetical protein